MDREKYQEHLKNEHNISKFASNVKEIVYGGTDGIITTFAVVSGFSGASLGSHALDFSLITVLIFGWPAILIFFSSIAFVEVSLRILSITSP